MASRWKRVGIWGLSGVAFLVTVATVLGVFLATRLRQREVVRRDLSRLSSVGRVLRDELCKADSQAVEPRLDAYISELWRSSLDRKLVASEELAMRAFYVYARTRLDGHRESADWGALVVRCKSLRGAVCTAEYYRRYAASVCERNRAAQGTQE
jgi:hypothetical protein